MPSKKPDGKNPQVADGAALVKIAAIASVAVTIASIVLWRTVADAFEEHHIIESAQTVFLAFATGLHIGRMCTSGNSTGYSLHATLGVLMVSVFLRELDIDDFGSSPHWERFEWILRLGAVALWIVLGTHLIRRWKGLLQQWRVLAFSPCSRFVWIGIILYGISWFFDKEIFPLTLDTSMFFEETLQLNATLFFFLGALLARGVEWPRFRPGSPLPPGSHPSPPQEPGGQAEADDRRRRSNEEAARDH